MTNAMPSLQMTIKLSYGWRPFLAPSDLFQRSFHDHIIRGEADYREIWEYIDGNPARWGEDCFYSE